MTIISMRTRRFGAQDERRDRSVVNLHPSTGSLACWALTQALYLSADWAVMPAAGQSRLRLQPLSMAFCRVSPSHPKT